VDFITSKTTIYNIINCIVLSPSDIAPSKIKEGRLPAGGIVNKITPETQIDALVVKKQYPLICDGTAEFEESDIRSRKTFYYQDVSKSNKSESRLAVKTKFFKEMEDTDTIYLILH